MPLMRIRKPKQTTTDGEYFAIGRNSNGICDVFKILREHIRVMNKMRGFFPAIFIMEIEV